MPAGSLPSDFHLIFWLKEMAILSKVCASDIFESRKSIKFIFTNIQQLRSNFVDCEFFLQSNSPDILASCEANLEDS